MNEQLRNLTINYINQFVDLCDEWKFKNENEPTFVINDLSSAESRSYEYLKKEFYFIRCSLLHRLIEQFLCDNNVKAKKIELNSFTKKTFVIDNKLFIQNPHNELNEELLLLLEKNNINYLYFFKDSGIDNRLCNERLSASLTKSLNVSSIIYVNFMTDYAWMEILNHNQDEDDPSHGTDTISLKTFFIDYMNEEAYQAFIECCDLFMNKVKEHFNFEIVKNLKNSNLYSYREKTLSIIANYNYKMQLKTIEQKDFNKINSNFFKSNRYKCLIGKNDFAECFMTAEWLYNSLYKATHIDLSPIFTGYLKSIEQFLQAYIFQYIDEINKKTNDYYKLYLKYGEETSLNSKNINKISGTLTLGNLTNFFGYYDKKNDKIIIRNFELFLDSASKQTYIEIIKILTSLAKLRNGYFHKDNIHDWNIIESARNSAYTTFFLMLGAYKFKESFETNFGVIQENETDAYKLCKYMDTIGSKTTVKNNTVPLIPIFQISGYSSWFYAQHDMDISYDEFGYFSFSGIHLKPFGFKNDSIKFFPIDNLPNCIKQGFIEINFENNQLNFKEPNFTKIYENGKFTPINE